MSGVCARCGGRASQADVGAGARCTVCGEPLDEPATVADVGAEPRTERSVPAALPRTTPWASPASLVQGNIPKVTVGRPTPAAPTPPAAQERRQAAVPPPPPGVITGGAAPLPPPPSMSAGPARVPGVPSLPTSAPGAPPARVAPIGTSLPLGSGVPALPTIAPGAAPGRTLLGTPVPASPVPAPRAIARTMIGSPLPAAAIAEPMIEAASTPLSAPPVAPVDAEASAPDLAAMAAARTLQPEEVPQERSVPPLSQPLGFLREQPPPRRELLARASWKAAVVAVGAIAVVGAVAFVLLRGPGREGRAARATVQLALADGTSGSGFFVDGPDDAVYVATSFHVIEGGGPVTVRRSVGVPGGAYVEAFPETEVVAADPGGDLALLRLRDVPKRRIEVLPLAAGARPGEVVTAFGFPGRTGLASAASSITRVERLPSYDQRKPGAVEGLLVSTELPAGFSGGPTLNARGEVVGVSLARDGAYAGPAAAVEVVALRRLLASVIPARAAAPPGAEDVQRLLARIEVEVLMQPLADRPRWRERDLVAAGDLPRLRALAAEVRRLGFQALGVFPGRLETYQAPGLQERLRQCARDGARRVFETEACAHAADGALAWDFMAAALRWQGKVRPLRVTKIAEVDREERLYRAEVTGPGLAAPLPVFVAVEQGRPRLRLFDGRGGAYWLEHGAVGAAPFAGRWVQRQKNRCEEVVLSARDGAIAATYTLEREARAAAGGRKRGGQHQAVLRSAVQADYAAEVSQEDALVLVRGEAAPRREGLCEPDLCAIAPSGLVLKLADDSLHAYRAGADGAIESSQLRRARDGCSAPASAVAGADVGPKAKRGKKGPRAGHLPAAAAPGRRGAGKPKAARKRGH